MSRRMDYTIQELVNKVGIKTRGVITAALCRPEYSHIKRIKYGKGSIYTNVYPLDILKLRTFSQRRGTRENVEEVMKAYKLLCALPIGAKEEFVTKILRKYCKI